MKAGWEVQILDRSLPFFRNRIGRTRSAYRGFAALASLMVGLLLLGGCAAPQAADGARGASGGEVARVVPPASAPALDDQTGLLVLHLDTDVAISGLATDRMKMVGSLAKGRYVWIVAVPAGPHAWRRIEFALEESAQPRPRYCRRARNLPIDPRRDLQGVRRSEFEFDVRAGAINYPGELILRGGYGTCGVLDRLVIRNRNHAAMALESLLKTHPAIVEAFPLRNAGASGDTFLEAYDRERARVAADPAEVGK